MAICAGGFKKSQSPWQIVSGAHNQRGNTKAPLRRIGSANLKGASTPCISYRAVGGEPRIIEAPSNVATRREHQLLCCIRD
jgi:hypothetical protein